MTCDSCGQKLNVSEDVLLEGEIESVLTAARTLSLIFQSFSAMRKMTSVMLIVHHATVVRTQKNN